MGKPQRARRGTRVSADNLVLATDLAAKDFTDEVAGLADLRQGEGTVHIPAVPASADHPGSFQNGKVLREIRLRDPETFLQGGNALFAAAQQIEHLETFGVGEGAANRGLPFENFAFDGP